MKIVKQLAITAANKTGVLSKIIELLAKNNLNIIALAISESMEQGIIRLVVERHENAVKLLEPDYEIRETDVLQVEVPNQPGSLASITAKLGVADINIDYIYASAGASGGQTTVIIKVPDMQKAMAALV